MRRAGIVVLAGALTLAACSSSAGHHDPTWVPSPPFGANGGEVPGNLTPIIPSPKLPTQRPSAGGSSSTPPKGKKQDPAVVAEHLTSPVGLTMMPDGSALVGERTTGLIVRVQPRPNQPVPTVRVLHGLDTSGDGGLLDLAISPDYAEDNLIYAYITTPKDNRVVEFTLTGPVTPVLTGIPKGRTDNTGRLLFAPNGELYVGTGDAGVPSRAEDPASLAGKILRVTDIGRPAPGNPVKGSAVYSDGLHLVDGLCEIARPATLIEVETGGPATPDEVNVIGAGQTYGWPVASGLGRSPIATLAPPLNGPGDCAVDGGRLWVTSLNGQALLSTPLRGSGPQLRLGAFTPVLKGKYGRLKTVVTAPDGALWLTTSNRDGHGTPVPADERVIRYIPTGNGGGGKST
jgi:glucose/arabinose dehydrogenase